jgi:hypothetical protein
MLPNSLAFVLSYNGVTTRQLSHKIFSEISSWFRILNSWRVEVLNFHLCRNHNREIMLSIKVYKMAGLCHPKTYNTA